MSGTVNYTDYDTISRTPYRQRDNIAPHLQRNVCLCREPGPLQTNGSKCSKCHNLPVYWIYKCVKCEAEFLHDFVLNFCYKEPLCWDCNKIDNVACEGHLYCDCGIKGLKPPSTVMKKPFTQEELDAVFDF